MLEEVESLAVDYFELNGFLVRRGLGTVFGASDPVFPTLIVRNLKEEEVEEHLMFNFQWFSSDITRTRRAVVAIVGEGIFSLGSRAIRQDKRLFQILKKQLFSKQSLQLPWEISRVEGDLHGHRKLILLPLLPSSETHRTEICDKLASKGADGVITFRTLLDNIIQQLDNLDESRLTRRLKILRVLKQMELLKIPQLDLFDE